VFIINCRQYTNSSKIKQYIIQYCFDNMNNQTANTLRKFGLTDTEISIYLTSLSFPSITVNELVKQTNIKRTTIYHALETLTQKGLCAKKQTFGKQAFSVTDPKNIENLLEEKINELQSQKKALHELLPLLEQNKKKNSSMVVSHYEGIEGIKLVVEDALYCKSKHWDIISPIKNFFSEFDKDYAEYFVRTRKIRQLTARSLWEDYAQNKNLSGEILKERNPKVLPSVMQGKFKSVICLYDDKVLIISSFQELSAILIQSQEFFETMQAVFDGLWQSSKNIK